MKQKPQKYSNKSAAYKAKNIKSAEPKLNLFYCIVLLGYAFITVLTPNLNTLDSNGPKFYTLAILNLFAYIIILSGNKLKPRQDFYWSFFRTWTGLIYTLFLLVSILSFFKALNIFESIINFSKLFTIFSAAYIVSTILRQDKRYIYVISIALVFLLIFDSLTVFYDIAVNRMRAREIKSIYSNKNILAAAIFVKISFVLWLLSFGKRWVKILGGFTLFISLVAILLMNTRSFFIGSIFIGLTYGSFMIMRFYRKNDKRRIIFSAMYLTITVILVFLAFSFFLKYLNPESKQSGVTAFIERLKTLSREFGPETAAGGARKRAWKHSSLLIKANPILGIGTGNWKVEVLKYETPLTGAYIYQYKNHNDFIETTADIGIFGGALFIGIFIVIFGNFINAFLKARKEEEESYKWLFLPAFGLFCYSFDAMFNFPSDRPEIISFFAIFVGAGVAFSPQSAYITRFSSFVTCHLSFVTRKASRVTFIATLLLLMAGSIYIFYLNFVSLKLQRIAKEELNAGNLTSSSDLFLNGFPAIPDINIEGEPIAVSKARYLIVEKKYQQAIDLLKQDQSSPYDTRQEFFIAMAYLNMGLPDSTLVYTQKVYKMKPYFSGNFSVMSSAYEAKGNFTEALKVLEDHIKLNSDNRQPIMDNIYKQLTSITTQARIQQNQEPYNKGMEALNRKDYNKALKYFSEFIDKEPGVAQAFEYRAFCYFYLNKFQQSFNEIERAIALDPTKPGYLNLRGVNLHMLGNDPAACEAFTKAIEMGDKDAVNNYEKFCKKK